MKILFVSDYYLPYISGITVYARNLLEKLAERDCFVTVLTNLHKDGLLSEELIKHVVVKRFKPLFKLSRGFVSLKLISGFVKNISKSDIVIFNLPMLEASLFAFLTFIFRKKLIMIYQANLNLPSWSWSSKLIEKIVLLNHLAAGFFANKIVTSSEDYANFAQFLKCFKNKQVVITPPILIGEPDKKESRRWKEKLGLLNNKIVGFAGRFAEEKGGDILIESLEYLTKAFPNIKLLFAGETNLAYEDFYKKKRNLVEKYKSNIIFLGLIPQEKMSKFYGLCDVLALPSRADCFPAVLVEAMLCGTPVVAFDIPGGRVPILKTGMGELAKKYDRKDFAEKIVKVLKNKKDYIQSRRKIENVFNFPGTIQNYENIFARNN